MKIIKGFAERRKHCGLKSCTLQVFSIASGLPRILVFLLRMTPSHICCKLILILSDQYTSPKIIKLMELENEKKTIEDAPKISSKKKKRLAEIEREMVPLKKFLEDARAQRQAIRKEIGMLALLIDTLN